MAFMRFRTGSLVAPLLLLMSLVGHGAEDPGAPTNTLRERWNRANQIDAPDQTNSCTKAVSAVAAKISGSGIKSTIQGKDEYTLCFWNGAVVESVIGSRMRALQQTMKMVTLKAYHARVSDQMAQVQASLKTEGGNICGAGAGAKAAVSDLDSYLQCDDKARHGCDTEDFKAQVKLITEMKARFAQIVSGGAKPDGSLSPMEAKLICRNADKGAKEALALFADAEKKCATTLGYMTKTMGEVHQLKQSLGSNCQ